MKNESPLKKQSNLSTYNYHQHKSSLPTLNLPIRESKSKEKSLKVKDDKYIISSNVNLRQLVVNKNKNSKIKLKAVKIISTPLSFVKNPKTANESLSMNKANGKVFLKESSSLIQQANITSKFKPKTTHQVILRGITTSKEKEGDQFQGAFSQDKAKGLNYPKKKYRIKTDPLTSELLNTAIRGSLNSNNSNTTNQYPLLNKSSKKKKQFISLSMNLTKNNTGNQLNANKKHADTDPQQHKNELISIKEYVYKENPNLNSRKAMEDFYYINDNVMPELAQRIALFAIFDGHNGSSTAIYCQRSFERLLIRYLKETKMKIEESLEKAFLELDEEIKRVKPDITKSGTTATAVVIYSSRLYCANVGDSSCFLFQHNRSIKMSFDHNLKDPKEVKRIKERGGLVFNERIFGALNLSRVLGDIEMKSYGVIANPTINTQALTSKDKYVVIASDGVWNYYNERLILDIINKDKSISAACLSDAIVSSAFKNGSLDNISCIVIKL